MVAQGVREVASVPRRPGQRETGPCPQGRRLWSQEPDPRGYRAASLASPHPGPRHVHPDPSAVWMGCVTLAPAVRNWLAALGVSVKCDGDVL